MVLCQQGVSRGFIQQGVSRGFMPGVFNCTHSRVKNTQDDTRGGNGKFEEESHEVAWVRRETVGAWERDWFYAV